MKYTVLIPIFLFAISGLLAFGSSPEPVQHFTPMATTAVNLTFNETGLPSGAVWTGTASGLGADNQYHTYSINSSSSQYTISSAWNNAPPSSVSYTMYVVSAGGKTYVPSPTSGTVVTYNSNNYVDVSYSVEAGSPVTVIAKGLPQFTVTWGGYITNNKSLTININTTAALIQFALPSGQYYYHFNNSSNPILGWKYVPVPSQGYFYVTSSNYTLNVYFLDKSPDIIRNVIFKPHGLPDNTTWTLFFNGTDYSSTSDIYINISGGYYSVVASAAASGYEFSGPTHVYVNEYDEVIQVNFTAPSPSWENTFANQFKITAGKLFAVLILVSGTVLGIVAMAKTNSIAMLFTPSIILVLIGTSFNAIGIGYFFLVLTLGVAAFIIDLRADRGGAPGA